MFIIFLPLPDRKYLPQHPPPLRCPTVCVVRFGSVGKHVSKSHYTKIMNHL